MTITIREIKTDNGTGYIEQEKYSVLYHAIVIDRHNCIVLNNNYLSEKAAKQAIKRELNRQ